MSKRLTPKEAKQELIRLEDIKANGDLHQSLIATIEQCEIVKAYGVTLKEAIEDFEGSPVIVRLSIPGNSCVHCGAIVTKDLKCPGCGWIDPVTKKPE